MKINFVIDSEDDKVLFEYMINIPLRRRATYLRLIASEHISGESHLGLAPQTNPVRETKNGMEKQLPGRAGEKKTKALSFGSSKERELANALDDLYRPQ
ncbi:MAG: hypothetical protein HOP36_04690 [Methyloglobulus sp.]|nr:hypothetical protein [Methyloglobulus sp.]